MEEFRHGGGDHRSSMEAMTHIKPPEGTHYEGENSADDTLASRLTTIEHMATVEASILTYEEAADIASETVAWVAMRVKNKDVSGSASRRTVRRGSLMAYLETRRKR